MKYKYLKQTLLFYLIICMSCGGTQNVIMDSGNVYSIKNDEFFLGEKNLTSELSEQQKSEIKSVLEDRLQAEEKRTQQLEDLENQIEDLKNQIKDLEKTVESIEDKQRNLEKARENYIASKMALISKEREFEKLKKSGNLSEQNKIEFEKEILSLKEKVMENKRRLESIR